MGVKRPLEEENLTELSFEQPKQHDSYKKLTLVTQDFPSHPTAPIVFSPGQENRKLYELDSFVMPVNGEGAFMGDKELDASIPFSLVTSSSMEEHVGNQDSSLCYKVPGFIDFTLTRLPPEQFEDPYAFMLNSFPRKDIPIGPDHQVEVTDWDPNYREKIFSGSINLIKDEWEKKLMGACIILSPDLDDSSIDTYAVGRGRSDCCCPDMMSVRCVQQHVREAREKLMLTMGEESFIKLGFSEMGEEVIASRWSDDEEQLFRKVVVSNPASLGTDFWKHLTIAFPTRTKNELVSYYFNVFMLRKRGVQNRSYLLEIDSDDDEDLNFSGVHYPSTQYMVEEDGDGVQHTHFHIGVDDDSDVESSSEQELDEGWEDDYGAGPEYIGLDNRDGILPKVDENVSKQDI